MTKERWDLIVREKHPVMRGREVDVRSALESPHEVRQSRHDANVYLFYSVDRPGRWVCAVAKRDGADGFLITTYPADAVKERATIWPN